IAVLAALAALSSLVLARQIGPSSAFFLGGFALLIAGLATWRAHLHPLASNHMLTHARLAALNLTRRPTRSLVAIGTLASALFLVVSVTSFQKHDTSDWQDSSSGTGGYGLWIETTTPLNRRPSGDFEFQMQDDGLTDVLALRAGRGDDASCFNLNSVSQPRLLAADTSTLDQHNAFTIGASIFSNKPTWSDLQQSLPGDPLLAYIDKTTLLWVLKKKLGDTINYTDDAGSSFPVKIAGTLTESVFQGNLIVDETRFLERYPSSPGYRLFLAKSATPPKPFVAQLQKRLPDLGATVATTSERLSAFHGVENTYISIFNVLGGLGVILGSAGLGIVTARGLAERRDEFAMLHTIGIPTHIIRSVITREIRQLILTALVIGLTAAILSIAPALPHQPKPAATLAWVFGLALLTTLCAATSAWLAYRALRTRNALTA
ncbi:MAG: FtsX-like permease family protein, partial [Verrucomicrobiales bacterium]